MNQSASPLDGDEKKRQLIEHIWIRKCPTSRQVQEPVPAESSLQSIQSMETLVDELVMRMRAIGEQYGIIIHSATTELMGRLDRIIESSPVSGRDESNIRHEITNAENVFDSLILEAARQMSLRYEMLVEEVVILIERWSGEIFEKILQTEALVLSEEVRIQQMIEDPTVGLGYLMRAGAAHREMKAYLKGLKFRVQESTE